MTTTQAKWVRNEQTDQSFDPATANPEYFSAYNKNSDEPSMKDYYVQVKELESESESSESDSESESEWIRPHEEVTVLWHVAPDYGELDDHVVTREKDLGGKDFQEKKSGWSNPLGWSDEGGDDDLVLPMLRQRLRYDESEGPTKADNGEDDPEVVEREPDMASENF